MTTNLSKQKKADDLTPIATTTVTCKIDCLPGDRIGLGIYTQGGGMTQEGADCVAALLATLQDFCNVNEFLVNVYRGAQ